MIPHPVYDRYYYQVYDGRPYERNAAWLGFFGDVAQQIVSRIGPKTTLDAGCALGFLVETLRERGVEAYGVDISEYAIEHTHPSVRPYCRAGSITEPFAQKYDLIVTIEVLEHLERAEAEQAVANLCRHSDDILFSSTPSEFKDLTHINVQPPEAWAELFARQGFYQDLDFDFPLIPWAVRYRRRTDPPPRILMEIERSRQRLLKENTALRQLGQDLHDQLVEKTETLAERENLVANLRNQMGELHNQVGELRNQVEDITHSRAFRLARQVRRLAPLGSRRERVVLKISSVFAKIFREHG